MPETPVPAGPATQEGATAVGPGQTPQRPGTSDEGVAAPDVELLGLLAAFELADVARLAAVAQSAPGVGQRIERTRVAAAAMERCERLVARLEELGVDPVAAIEPFDGQLDDFERRTAPKGWDEEILRDYVGRTAAEDFASVLAEGARDPRTRELLHEVARASATDEDAVAGLARHAEADDVLAARLALWARRVFGEALLVAQDHLSTRPVLASVAGELATPGTEAGAWVMRRLTERHAERMRRLGFAA